MMQKLFKVALFLYYQWSERCWIPREWAQIVLWAFVWFVWCMKGAVQKIGQWPNSNSSPWLWFGPRWAEFSSASLNVSKPWMHVQVLFNASNNLLDISNKKITERLMLLFLILHNYLKAVTCWGSSGTVFCLQLIILAFNCCISAVNKILYTFTRYKFSDWMGLFIWLES